jgi:membrane associated rhomboid family serine protease
MGLARGAGGCDARAVVESLLAGPISLTFALIALNVAVSLPGFWALRRERYSKYFLFIPYRAARGENWLGTLLSHFSHGDVGHLLLNSIVLYFFGRGVEAALGPAPYLLLYGASGAMATLTVFLFRRNNPRHAALGASGCIAGVMFASVVIAPSSTFFLWPVPFPVPAPVFAVLYLVISSAMMGRGDRVAHEAHIGGALAGLGLGGLLFEDGFGPLVEAVTRLTS